METGNYLIEKGRIIQRALISVLRERREKNGKNACQDLSTIPNLADRDGGSGTIKKAAITKDIDRATSGGDRSGKKGNGDE